MSLTGVNFGPSKPGRPDRQGYCRPTPRSAAICISRSHSHRMCGRAASSEASTGPDRPDMPEPLIVATRIQAPGLAWRPGVLYRDSRILLSRSVTAAGTQPSRPIAAHRDAAKTSQGTGASACPTNDHSRSGPAAWAFAGLRYLGCLAKARAISNRRTHRDQPLLRCERQRDGLTCLITHIGPGIGYDDTVEIRSVRSVGELDGPAISACHLSAWLAT